MINKFKLPFGFLRAKEMPGPGKFNIWIAMLGFSLGCIALIVSISILNGFENKVKKTEIYALRPQFEAVLSLTNLM